jgi:regulator of sigma E protease
MILGIYAAAAVVAWFAMFTVYAAVTAAMSPRAGLPVEAVKVGMGPALWRREIRGTEYSLRLLPLGASVKCPMDDDDAASWDEALPRPGAVRLFSNLALGQQLLITVSGNVVVLLLGVALLAVAVLAAAPQLAACDRPESMVQPCGMPGLRGTPRRPP